MELSPDSKLDIPDTTLFQELDGECVLLNLANESYYGLNETGTSMWNALAETDSIAAALQTLLNEYDIDEKKLRADLLHLIHDLLENQLATVRR